LELHLLKGLLALLPFEPTLVKRAVQQKKLYPLHLLDKLKTLVVASGVALRKLYTF
jgi:hypothetical protein